MREHLPVRWELRKQAKKESGGFASRSKKATASKVGTAIRKITKGSKYGLKKVGKGADLPLPDKDKPVLKSAGTTTRKFAGQKDKTTKAGAVTKQEAKSNVALAARTVASTKRTGGHSAVEQAKDKGFEEAPEFKENVKKKAAAKYKTGERTEAQIKYDNSIEARRRTFIRKAGGKKGKGQRKFKKARKEELKEQYAK